MSITAKRGDVPIVRDLYRVPYLDRVQAIDLVSDGLYFIARDPDTGYWVYVDAVEREVKVFDKFVDALAYGLHVSPEEIRNIDVVGVKEGTITLRICTTEGCDNYRAYLK
ncbi:MAG: hypothetical protein L7H00_06055 [Vulcanisaeta sp.]|nr:hypothetical protein [Vulcanisaeta sp.]